MVPPLSLALGPGAAPTSALQQWQGRKHLGPLWGNTALPIMNKALCNSTLSQWGHPAHKKSLACRPFALHSSEIEKSILKSYENKRDLEKPKIF
jgi:hypothetical protein